MSTDDPLQLGPSRRSIVRLNRRVLYIVGAVLIVAFATGLIALRAQATRPAEGTGERRPRPSPPSRPWFEDIPDQEPAPRPLALDPPPAASSPTSANASLTDEDEIRRWQRVVRVAMSAPIGVSAFERLANEHLMRQPEGHGAAGAALDDTTLSVRSANDTTPRVRPANDTTVSARPANDSTPSVEPAEYLRASVRKPASPYEVKAGTIIPAVLLTAINSELAGQIVGQVRENVYDSDTGEHLLIPQGTRLVGLYDHHIVYGQRRVLITWKRLLLPDGSSLSLPGGMPGTDSLGGAGFQDAVNNHYLRIFGNALLLSVISAGVQLSQVPDFGRDFRGPNAGNVLGAAVGQQLGSVSSELIRRGLSVAPTLEIRPGYAFNVMVTQDVVFPGPYPEASSP